MREAIKRADPYRNVYIPEMSVTAAQLRERADREEQQRLAARRRVRAWAALRRWMRGLPGRRGGPGST